MVFKLQTQVGQHKKFWYLLHQRAAMAHTSLSNRTVLPEPSLLACTMFVFKLQTQVGQHKRFWYISHSGEAMAHASLNVRRVPPETSLLAYTKYCIQAKYTLKVVSEYDQEIPQSQTADNLVAPRGRAAQPPRDTTKTN